MVVTKLVLNKKGEITKMNVEEYKGYIAKVQYSEDEKIYHGRIEGIDDLVTFESSDEEKIIEEFHAAVDDYLVFCDEMRR